MTTKETKILKLDLRLRELVEANTHKTRRNLELQELTDIPASLWSNWWAGRARPSSEMLMALCIKWPETTLWLMTGAIDLLAGQVAPSTSVEKQQTTATRYLRRLTEIMDLKNPEVGYDFLEHEVDELNALGEVRKRELERRLQAKWTGDQTLNESELIKQDMDTQTIVSLIERLKKGWTFHECLRAQFTCLHTSESRQATAQIQALRVGIRSFQEKISIEEAFLKIEDDARDQGATTNEICALSEAKKLLGIE